MIDFKALETALWVARLESFNATAERLNTTQPAISIRIAELETALGTNLFDRTGRKVVVTPAGRQLIDYAERLLRLRAEMIDQVGARAARRGILRLGVAETIVHSWLPRFLEQMTARYPALTIDLDVDISTTLRERLLQHRLDLAFAVGPLATPAILERKLCRLPVRFIASPRLNLPARRIDLDTITAWPILTFARNTLPYVQVVELLGKAGGRQRRIFSSASLATLVRMALDGIGIAVIPPAIVSDELADRRLTILSTRRNVPDLSFVAAWTVTPDGGLIDDIVDLSVRIAAMKDIVPDMAAPLETR